MDTSTGAREVAEHALLRLVALRVIPSPSLAEVAEIASQVRLPPGSDFSSPATTSKARVEAWLAIRKIVRTFEGNPGAKDMDALWGRALDLTTIWLQAIKG
jgi:hypothetical protein